jgi:hypothetical protein
MADDATVDVDDVNRTVAHAGVSQPCLDPVKRHNRGEHPGELAVRQERYRHDQRRAIVLPERERLTKGIEALDAGSESALQGSFDEGISVSADASSRLPSGLPVDGRHVQNIRIILDKVLQKARNLGGVGRVVHVFDPARQCEHLPLA